MTKRHSQGVTTPASIVIERFGGIRAVAEALSLERTAVQRWTYDKPKGTGGTVPQKHWAPLMERARQIGIELQADDLLPPNVRAS